MIYSLSTPNDSLSATVVLESNSRTRAWFVRKVHAASGLARPPPFDLVAIITPGSGKKTCVLKYAICMSYIMYAG